MMEFELSRAEIRPNSKLRSMTSAATGVKGKAKKVTEIDIPLTILVEDDDAWEMADKLFFNGIKHACSEVEDDEDRGGFNVQAQNNPGEVNVTIHAPDGPESTSEGKLIAELVCARIQGAIKLHCFATEERRGDAEIRLTVRGKIPFDALKSLIDFIEADVLVSMIASQVDIGEVTTAPDILPWDQKATVHIDSEHKAGSFSAPKQNVVEKAVEYAKKRIAGGDDKKKVLLEDARNATDFYLSADPFAEEA